MQQIEMNFGKVAEIFTGRGPRDAKTSREVAKILNRSIRDLTAILTQERREGHAMLAGYYLTETREQVYRSCRALERKGRGIHTQKAQRKAIQYLPAAGDIAGRPQPPPITPYRS